MSTIVAGHFANRAQAQDAVNTLLAAGIESDHILRANYMHASLPDGGSPRTRRASGPEDTTISRPAGVLVAVNTSAGNQRDFASDVLRQNGASEVEETDRFWRDGKWVELDLASHEPTVKKSFW